MNILYRCIHCITCCHYGYDTAIIGFSMTAVWFIKFTMRQTQRHSGP